MSYFIKKEDDLKYDAIELLKQCDKNNIEHCINGKEDVYIIITLKCHVNGSDNRIVEQALYLLYRYNIKYLNLIIYGVKSYKNAIDIINSYRQVEYISIYYDTRLIKEILNGRLIYEVLKQLPNLKGIRIKFKNVFHMNVMLEISKLECNKVLKIIDEHHYEYERLKRDGIRIGEVMKRCRFDRLYIDNVYWIRDILMGLIENTHIKYLEIGRMDKIGQHNELYYSCFEARKTLVYLINEVIHKNTTLKEINFLRRLFINYDKDFDKKYKDFKNDNELKLYLYGKLIN